MYLIVLVKCEDRCQDGGAHLSGNFFLAFTDELEKQLFIKKTVEVGQ